MNVTDLKALIRWADQADDNVGFWKRLWMAAKAYDVRTCTLIKAMVARFGTIPESGWYD